MDSKLLILFAALLLVVALVTYYLFLRQDPLKVLNELYEKRARIKKYAINYSVSAEGSILDIPIKVKGNATVISINGSSKTVAHILEPSESITEYYYLPQGKFKCKTILDWSNYKTPEYECEKESESTIATSTSTEGVITPEETLDRLKNWTNKGIVNVSLNGTKKVLGRECYNFKFDVNLEKLKEEENFSANYSSVDWRKSKFMFFECLDKNSGLLLSFETIITITSNISLLSASLDITGEATNLSFDVGINKIELPVAWKEVKFFPKFEILNTSCEKGSDKVNVTIRAENNLSGIAILDLEQKKEIQRNYPYQDVTGYEHYCFTLSNITSNTSLGFEFKNVNDSYRRYFMISIDCPEVEGKRVYLPTGECKECNKGKYCSMEETFGFANYDFDSNLPGTHEICVWPSSEKGYLWTLNSIKVYKKTKLTSQLDIGRISKNEIRTLNFVLPSKLEYGTNWVDIYLTINNSNSSSYCWT
jgi:hypothetical protein